MFNVVLFGIVSLLTGNSNDKENEMPEAKTLDKLKAQQLVQNNNRFIMFQKR